MARPSIRCAVLFVQSTQTEGDDCKFSDEKKEEECMGVEDDVAIFTTHWEMLRAVYGGDLQSWENTAAC